MLYQCAAAYRRKYYLFYYSQAMFVEKMVPIIQARSIGVANQLNSHIMGKILPDQKGGFSNGY